MAKLFAELSKDAKILSRFSIDRYNPSFFSFSYPLKKELALFVSFIVLVSIFAIDANACSCAYVQTCELGARSDSVFVGKVLESSVVVRTVKQRVLPMGGDWEDLVREERRQVSRLQIEESFLGIGEAKEILIETDLSSSCAFPLTSGETYIVYAHKSDTTPNLMTGFCSGTKPISSASKELEDLRADRGKLSTVSGKAGFGAFGRLDPRQLKKFGVEKVRLIGTGHSEEEKIRSDGTFQFRGVPAGEYRLEVLLPESLIVDGEYNEEIAEDLGIQDQRLFTVSGIGCVIKQFPIRENGRITGQLFDERGEPIEDVEGTAIPVGKDGKPIRQEEPCYDTDTCVSSMEDGTYLIKGLKPGRYLIGVRLDDYICNNCADAEFKKTLYPGVANETRAKQIVVGFGKLVEKIDLKLSSRYVRREVKGIVVFKDGSPAANVSVRFVARTPDLKRNGITFIKTDANGYFSITAYDGHAYLIGASTDQRYGTEHAEAKAVVVKVSPGKALEELRLVLDRSETDDDYSDFDIGNGSRKN